MKNDLRPIRRPGRIAWAPLFGYSAEFFKNLFRSTWLYLDIDRTKCLALGIPVSNVFSVLQVYLGSYYINNFNEFGRIWQVNVQADPRFRNRVADIRRLQVRNNQGQMVRLATVLNVRDTSGPVYLMRYNMYSATAITGNTSPGTSSGEGIALMKELAGQELPRSKASDWTELTFLQLQAGNTAIYVFALAVVFVFLVLAAQYESWSLPFAVILVVRMCLLCSIVGVGLAQMEVTIFTQIGFVVLVGLASKNAILIVEFAKQEREAGATPREATLDASRLRLRPILMTSFAFIFGVAGHRRAGATGITASTQVDSSCCFGKLVKFGSALPAEAHELTFEEGTFTWRCRYILFVKARPRTFARMHRDAEPNRLEHELASRPSL